MEQAYKGKIQGIICWKLDRLARNPVDGGNLIWTLEEKAIEEVVTPQRNFTNTGNDKFWMQLEFGMAKKYVDDLSDNVRRGNKTKLEQGWLPGPAPMGYVNDVVARTIKKDPDRFPLVRQMWELMLTGTHSPYQIVDLANEDWGFRTRKTKRLGGKPLAVSTLYKVFGNPFYYGVIRRNNELYQGAHEPMVTKNEFDEVQKILRRNDNPRPKRHEFAFTGLIRCAECGCMVTAEEKVNQYGSHYTYYHCTKKKRHLNCSQGSIRLEALEKQVVEILNSISISDRFRDWAVGRLKQIHKEETSKRQSVDHSLDKAYRACQKKLDDLVGMHLRKLINDKEFKKHKSDLINEKISLKEKLRDAEHRADRWLELSEKAFIFVNKAKFRFENGSLQDKKQILSCIGSNLLLKDGKLLITAKIPFVFFDKNKPRPSWCTIVEEVRTFFANLEEYFEIPILDDEYEFITKRKT